MLEGEVIAGRYRVERQIGRGGMSRVYEAVDTKFDLPVALKIAYPPDEDYGEFLARFKREAKIGRLLGRLSAGFVRALDWGEYGDDALYLAMDLVEGATELDLRSGTLQNRLDRLVQACLLVREVHGMRIVHRDIKPANFLTSETGRIHLADFGLAKLLDESGELDDRTSLGSVTQSGFAMGTPYYMAPEQVDAKNVDERADVYALGVMLYQCLTGALPFEGNIGELLGAHERIRSGIESPRNPQDRVPSVPRDLNELCMDAMNLEVEDRLPSTSALLEGLGAGDLGYKSISITPDKRPQWTAPPVVADMSSASDPSAKTMVEPESVLVSSAQEAVAPATRKRRAPKKKKKASPKKKGGKRRPLPTGIRLREGVKGEFVNDRDGSVLVRIASGVFTPSAPDGTDQDTTRSMLRVEAYFIGRVPVTWAQYERFCKSTGRALPKARFKVDGRHPVHNVSYLDAWEYCAWAGVRLPTEEEWEFAARGDEDRAYPWGNGGPTPDRCNWAGHPEFGKRGTSPVGVFPKGASFFGCRDMAGNVLEWLGVEGDPLPWSGPPPDRTTCALRGGAFRLDPDACRINQRVLLSPEVREGHVGFRIARGFVQPAAPPRSRPTQPQGRPAGKGPRPPTSKPLGRPPTSKPMRRPPTSKPIPRQRPPGPIGAPVRARPQAPRGKDKPDPGRLVLRHVHKILPNVADSVARKGREIKFVYGKERVGISFVCENRMALWAFMEQRVTLSRDRLLGEPTGYLNLLHAANAVCLHVPGLRCVLSRDRLRFRREVFLSGRGPLSTIDLEWHIDRLLSSWTGIFQQLRDIQQGDSWDQLFFPEDGPSEEDEAGVKRIEDMLSGTDHVLDRLPDSRLGVGYGDDRVLLHVVEDEIRAELVVRSWSPPPQEALAVKDHQAAPSVDLLLEEINVKNHESIYALAWDPRQGVVARAVLAEADPTAARIEAFLDALHKARSGEAFESLGD